MARQQQDCSLVRLHARIAWALTVCVLFISARPVRAVAQSENPPAQSSARDAPYELDDSKGVVVPINSNLPGVPWVTVQASINGSKLYTFVVDTGADDRLFLQQWAESEVMIPLTNKSVNLHPGNAIAQVTSACDLEILGRDVGRNVDVHIAYSLVADLPILNSGPHNRIAGIIGVRPLMTLTTRFDFEKQTLTFFNFKHPVVHPKGAYSNLRLLDAKDGDILRGSFDVSGAGAMPFRIVTGSEVTYLPASGANRIDRVCSQSGGMHNDMSGNRPSITMLIDAINTDAIKLIHPRVLITLGVDVATLGLDILSCFRLTIDPDNRILTLEPRRGYRYRRPGRTGVTLTAQGDKIIVSQIELANTANTALQIGDIIVSIDGVPASELTVLQARDVVEGFEATEAEVVVKKPDGRMATIRIYRQSEFDDLVALPRLTLFKPKDKPFVIIESDVDATAAASAAQVGDELLKVDGKDALTQTVDQLYASLHSGSHTLTLHRKSEGKSVDVSYTGK